MSLSSEISKALSLLLFPLRAPWQVSQFPENTDIPELPPPVSALQGLGRGLPCQSRALNSLILPGHGWSLLSLPHPLPQPPAKGVTKSSPRSHIWSLPTSVPLSSIQSLLDSDLAPHPSSLPLPLLGIGQSVVAIT